MNMQLSRKQYKEILDALDNNIEKADRISEIIEAWTPVVSIPSNFGAGQEITNFRAGDLEARTTTASTGNGKPMTGFGKDPKKVGGVTE